MEREKKGENKKETEEKPRRDKTRLKNKINKNTHTTQVQNKKNLDLFDGYQVGRMWHEEGPHMCRGSVHAREHGSSVNAASRRRHHLQVVRQTSKLGRGEPTRFQGQPRTMAEVTTSDIATDSSALKLPYSSLGKIRGPCTPHFHTGRQHGARML